MPNRVFRELSLRQRLLLLTMFTSGIGVLIGCLGFLAYDVHVAREHKEEDLRSAANLIGTNSTAALAFDDVVSGSRLLESLSTRNQIRMGVLYRSDGTYFASYIRANLKGKILPPDRPPDGIVRSKNRLTHSSQVRLDRRELGWLYLESDFTDLQERMEQFGQRKELIALGNLVLVRLS